MMTTMFRTGLVLGALGLASPAFAQGILNTPVDGSNALELRFSRFNPGIDDEFDGGATPYGNAFDDKRPINFELEYDRQFWDGFGSIGIGVNLGYNRVRGNAVTLDGESSPDRTTLGVIPVRVGAVYRFDVLQRRYNVPFVIVAKLGLDYAFWTIRDGDKNVSEVPTTDGSTIEGTGGTAGWHGAVGVHLLLDWFSPVMANAFASNVGVVNSYFFAEYMVSRVDDFGSDTSWSLSQNQLWLGLAFEF
jgi:hypothetical protein